MTTSSQSNLTASVQLILVNTSETLQGKFCDVGADCRCRFKRGHTNLMRCRIFWFLLCLT